jgi:hypothetical protein
MLPDRNDNWIDLLSSGLFWDVDRGQVDSGKHIKWLAERILERGTWEDWVLLRNNIGAELLTTISMKLRLTPKTRNFLERYLHASDSVSR